MDLREPVVEVSGLSRRLELLTRGVARQPVLAALAAAALGYLTALGIVLLCRAWVSRGRSG